MSTEQDHEFSFLRESPIHSIFIPGLIGTGKTSLAMRLCDFFHEERQQPVLVFRHPRPELMSARGYGGLESFEELQELQDCIVWIDELQLQIPLSGTMVSNYIQRLLSLARQKNILLIISTSETRIITKGIEAYVGAFFIKDLEVDLIKQGSLIRKIIKRHCNTDILGFRLKKNEYLFYCRDIPNSTRKHEYSLPGYWVEEYSCPYRSTTQYYTKDPGVVLTVQQAQHLVTKNNGV